MPTVPAELTATEGVKAGCPLGTLTRFGVLHVWPPSVDVEMVTSSWAPPLNRESCQTTYNCPVRASIAGSGVRSPVRIGAGAALVRGSTLLGSLTPMLSIGETMVGPDQVSPPSVEVMTATFWPRMSLGPVERIKL